MILSVEHKYLFVAVPKTGTTSIEKYLIEKDSTAQKGAIKINGNAYKLKGHSTALQAKKSLGEIYDTFQSFGFVRHPYSRLVSGYKFYRQGGKGSQNVKRFKLIYLHKLQIALARMLPFQLWAFIYPYRSNMEFILDEQGERIVTYVGLFEKLGEDFAAILNKLSLEIDPADLYHINKSSGASYQKYFRNKGFLRILHFRHPMLKKDLDFYNDMARFGIPQ